MSTDEGRQATLVTEDVVELSLPVRADLAVLARLTAATVASRAHFGVEEIEDLRLAVDELCLTVLRGDTTGRLALCFERPAEDTIEISCTYIRHADASSGAAGSLIGEEDEASLSLRILEALVDEHGHDLEGENPRAWLRKRRVTESQ